MKKNIWSKVLISVSALAIYKLLNKNKTKVFADDDTNIESKNKKKKKIAM